jgi:hypothetical protein
VVHVQDILHDAVDVCNELHVRVLDAVVDHLDVMAGTVGSDMDDAGVAASLRGNGFQHRFQRLVRRVTAARHEGRTVQGAFLATGDAHADEVDSFCFQRFRTPACILEEGIAAVNDDIARGEVGEQLLQYLVHRGAGFDHQKDAARTFQPRAEITQIGAGSQVFVSVGLDKRFRFRGRPVEYKSRNLVPCQIPRQIGTHDGKADQSH